MSPEPVLEIYLINLRSNRTALFTPTPAIELFEQQSDDRIRRFVTWLSTRRFRIVAWLGRMLHMGHGYYVKLETRLDPNERVLKAMGLAERFVIFHSPSLDPAQVRRQFFSRLRRQCAKHFSWVIVDLVLSVASLAIAPLPGPNVIGWYPFLRSLSHYAAFYGTRRGLRSNKVEFRGLPELRTLEENLQAPGFDRKRIHAIAEDLRWAGLEQFLERMT